MSTEVIEHLQQLVRCDTQNPGATEHPAARYVADRIAAAGLPVEQVEPEPGRVSVVSRHSGRDRSLPALVVHCHLDVVPVGSSPWRFDPFGGVEADGCIWGRGTLDMKYGAAMMLGVQAQLAASGGPHRDVIFAYFADEEMGGALGAGWVVDNRRDLLANATWAIGEVGGFRTFLADGRPLYPVQVAEKGLLWLRASATGSGGHAALSDARNPIEALACFVTRLSKLAVGESSEPSWAASSTPSLTTLARRSAATTYAPTVVSGGDKTNVVPTTAAVEIDCRFVPGGEAEARATVLAALPPGVEVSELRFSPAVSAPADSELFSACARAIKEIDSDAVVVPYVFPGGTDAKHLCRLGIRCYGFMPLLLPKDFDHLGLLHAPDERVPVQALVDGYRCFTKLVSTF